MRLRGSTEKSIAEVEERLIHQCALRAKREGQVFELWYTPSMDKEMREILRLLKQVEKRYVVRYIDGTRKSPEQSEKFYYDVILQPWKERRRNYFVANPVRVTPGFPKDFDFGVKRPCLVIYKNTSVVDIYPHQEKVSIPGTERGIITVPKIKIMVTVLENLWRWKTHKNPIYSVSK